MTLPTKEEAKRAAETLADLHSVRADELGYKRATNKHIGRAIALLKAYAAGELVGREEHQALRERVYGNCFDALEDCGHCDYCTGDDLT